MGSKFYSRDIFWVYGMLFFIIVVARLSYQHVSHHYGKPATMNYLTKYDSSKICFKHYSRWKTLETFLCRILVNQNIFHHFGLYFSIRNFHIFLLKQLTRICFRWGCVVVGGAEYFWVGVGSGEFFNVLMDFFWVVV